jgi:hypothetical protein
MKKYIIIMACVILTLSSNAQKSYYAFNEKINLKEEKGQYLVKFTDVNSKLVTLNNMTNRTLKIVDNVNLPTNYPNLHNILTGLLPDITVKVGDFE